MKVPQDHDIRFVHLSYSPPLPLLYRRTGRTGAQVVGGKTGSHTTGHSETYWSKLKEIISLGYVPVDIAKELGFVAPEWAPPDRGSLDNEIAQGKYRLKTE